MLTIYLINEKKLKNVNCNNENIDDDDNNNKHEKM